MSPGAIEALLDAMAFAGIAILSVPVLSLDGRKRKLTEITDILDQRAKSGDESALDSIARKVRAHRNDDVARWRPVDRWCLWIGYGLMFTSSLGRLFT